MDSGLSSLNPRPVKVSVKDALGREVQGYYLSPMTIEASIWAAREFETSKGVEDGLSTLEGMFQRLGGGELTAASMEAVLKLSYRLILGPKTFKDRKLRKFIKRHSGKYQPVKAFTEGLLECFQRASVDAPEPDSRAPQKKKTA